MATDNTSKQALVELSQGRALSVDNLDEMGIITTLMYHYNRYRGLKAFLLDIDQNQLAYKGISSFLIATSPDISQEADDPIDELKAWIVSSIAELKNTNLTLVISCPPSSLYRFAEVIDQADPPLANIDFAPLHEFDEVVNDAKLKYDLLLLEQSEPTTTEE